MSTRRTIRLGTRGSDLAMRQAATVAERLESRRYEVELVEVETTGDRIDDELIHRLGKTGAFVRDLDEEVLAGEVDAAVHSMKDVPTESLDDLVVAGVPERGPARDVLVTPDGTGLEDLPEGATVGTASLRRGAQLLAERPDLDVQPLRGNVDTRVEKLLAPARQREHERRLEAAGELGDSDDDRPTFDRSVEAWFDDLAEVERRALERTVDVEYDAIVLAEAGLERSGLLHHVAHDRLPTAQFVPAPGQGALAVTAADEETVTAVREVIDHPHTRVEATAERTVLDELGGGCVAPVGIYAVLQGPVVRTTVRVLDRGGDEEVAETRELPVDTHPDAARTFAADLRERGAAEIIDRARRRAEENT
jgi:hydroxymethylbilane synthase